MSDPNGDQVGGEVFTANTVGDALAAWSQIDAQHQADVHQAELQVAEEAAILGGLAMLGRWRQSRQPRMGTPEEYQRVVARQARNAVLVLAAIGRTLTSPSAGWSQLSAMPASS